MKRILFSTAALTMALSLVSANPAQAVACTSYLSSQTGVTDNSTSTYCVLAIASGSNTWTAPANVTTINLLVVGGGGSGNGFLGGGNNFGGGGGGGLVVIANNFSVTPSGTYSITIGGGGLINYGSATGANGSSSIFGSITALGGGAGGDAVNTTLGQSGGSAGGTANNVSASIKSTYSGIGTAYGNNGGAGVVGGAAGGGGGAGSAGSSAVLNTGGAGGSGLLIDRNGSGEFVTGSGSTTYGAGGSGAGSASNNGSRGNGIGAGGGGASGMDGDGSAGIVIISYLIAQSSNSSSVTAIPVPDPKQKSSIDSFTPSSTSSESTTAVKVNGVFVEKVLNIQVNGVNLPDGSWVQTPTTIEFTVAKTTSKQLLITLFNGAVPVLQLEPIKVTLDTAALTSKAKPISITCSKVGRRDLVRRGVAPICPTGYQKK